MENQDRQKVEPRNVTLYPVHWATVDTYAKDQGYGSTSAALRRIIDEWKQFKANKFPIFSPTPTEAEKLYVLTPEPTPE